MAIFYLNIRTVKRSAGRNAVAVAAYCSRSRLHDDRMDVDHDFTGYGGVIHSEIILPDEASAKWLDRESLWNEVERIAQRKDAQLADEIEFMFPRGLPVAVRVRLVQEFAATQFTPSGICVDINVVSARAKSGETECYAHALLLSRNLSGDVMGKKRLESNGWGAAEKWRERWGSLLKKAHAEEEGVETVGYWPVLTSGRGLDLVGRTVGVGCDVDVWEVSWRNGERIIADPGLAVDWLVREQSTFTREDLAAFVKERTAGPEQYSKALARVESSVEIVRVGKDALGEERYSKRAARGAVSSFDVSPGEASGDSGAGSGWSGGLIAACSTPAASGASGTLREAADVWEAAGFRLRGVGLTYEEAKAFERRLKIKSVGVKGLFQRWMKKLDRLEGRDVLIVNDAATLTRRQKEWMLSAARAVRAKLVFVDEFGFKVIDGADIGLDVEQLAAFDRAL